MTEDEFMANAVKDPVTKEIEAVIREYLKGQERPHIKLGMLFSGRWMLAHMIKTSGVIDAAVEAETERCVAMMGYAAKEILEKSETTDNEIAEAVIANAAILVTALAQAIRTPTPKPRTER